MLTEGIIRFLGGPPSSGITRPSGLMGRGDAWRHKAMGGRLEGSLAGTWDRLKVRTTKHAYNPIALCIWIGKIVSEYTTIVTARLHLCLVRHEPSNRKVQLPEALAAAQSAPSKTPMLATLGDPHFPH